ncbi:unnamed protein product [Caenorhabditis auriculariae]|uniref:Uncharacterized protein n=1 Tax=Caenorhabditis auriculariae TaxID=2777116 RepID=A0A8S1HCH7_9PELO|nr:unnamed protein product [Caenorhabditis auriculariae]
MEVILVHHFYFFARVFLAFGSSAPDVCCYRMMMIYTIDEAFPPECARLRCTREPIHAYDAGKDKFISKFLLRAKKINNLFITGNSTVFDIDNVEEVVYMGPGPVITLKHANLGEYSFERLKSITVKDPSIYCDKKNELVHIEGNLNADVRRRLEKVVNQTLAFCNVPTAVLVPVPVLVNFSVESSADSCPEDDEYPAEKSSSTEKLSSSDFALYASTAATGVLLFICTTLTSLSVRFYSKLREKDMYPVSSEALPLKIQSTEETPQTDAIISFNSAEKTSEKAPDVETERKIAGEEASEEDEARFYEEIGNNSA